MGKETILNPLRANPTWLAIAFKTCRHARNGYWEVSWTSLRLPLPDLITTVFHNFREFPP